MWSCGVTVSTPDSESGNPSSNLGRTFILALVNTYAQSECSLRGSNPRPSAHKTDALTTELNELPYDYNARGV